MCLPAPPPREVRTQPRVDAPLVRVKAIDFKEGEWRHVAMVWNNFDTGKPDARATLYLDGKPAGSLADREIAMAWNVARAGIYFAVNYVGLLDELAVFNRPLTDAEVAALHKSPELLSPLK